ncbi:MAG: LysR family transcriptional regulator [Pseudomonadota bacterium]
MNLNKLRQVVAVYQAGSFSAAASALNLSQSALTKAVASVEQSIGRQIFLRTAKGVQLTETGRSLVDRLVRILNDVDDLITDTAADTDMKTRRLRVGITPPSLEAFIVDAVARVITSDDKVTLEISGLRADAARRALRQGDIDLLLAPTPTLAAWNEVTAHDANIIRPLVFVRLGHPLASLDDPTVVNLAKFDFVAPTNIQQYSKVLRQLDFNSERSSKQKMHVIDYFPLVTRIVEMTDCFSVVSKNHIPSASFSDRFRVLDIPEVFDPLELSFAFSDPDHQKPLASRFVAAFNDPYT